MEYKTLGSRPIAKAAADFDLVAHAYTSPLLCCCCRFRCPHMKQPNTENTENERPRSRQTPKSPKPLNGTSFNSLCLNFGKTFCEWRKGPQDAP